MPGRAPRRRRLRGRGAALAGLCLVLLAAGRRLGLRRLTVAGGSMRPALDEGDRVIVVRWGDPRPGDVVAFRHPSLASLIAIKRVAAVEIDARGRRRYRLLGDNPVASTDSRDFGTVRAPALLGRAVYRYAPPARRGRLSAVLEQGDGGGEGDPRAGRECRSPADPCGDGAATSATEEESSADEQVTSSGGD